MPQIHYRGSALDSLPTTKAQALLFYLVAKHKSHPGEAVSKEQLTALLWPGMPQSSAFQNLRQTLYQIRKEIPTVTGVNGEEIQLLQTGRKTVGIHPKALVRTDLDLFYTDAARNNKLEIKDMKKLVSDYQGPFLENFYVPASSAYDDWIESMRSHILPVVTQCLRDLTNHFHDQHNHRLACTYAKQLIRLDPYSEQAHLFYIRSLYELGERNKALKAYQDYVQLLNEELGVEPGDEIRRLYDQIISTKPMLNHSIQPGRFQKQRNNLFIGLGVLIALVLGVWGWGAISDHQTTGNSSIRIAVLPFENRTTRDYLAEGLTDDIITQLSKVEGLSVISRQSSAQYANTQKPPEEIGRELHVPYLLRGNVQEIEDQFKVNIQFVEAASGELKWAESFVRTRQEVFAFQNAIAKEVVNNLRSTFELQTDPDFTTFPTQNTEAYNLYLQGKYRFYQAHPRALHQATELFEKALELDPDFHLARAWLAWTYCTLAGSWGDENADQMYPKVQEELAKIADVPAIQGKYNKVLGWMNLWLLDRDKAENYLQQAAQIDPSSDFGLSGYAMVLTLRRNFVESQLVAQQALNTNPHCFWNYFVLGQAYFYDGQFSKASTAIDTALQLFANHQASISMKGSIYTFQGKPQQAISYLTEQLNRLSSRPASFLGDIGVAYAVAGEKELALTFANELVERHQQGEKYTAYFAAKIYSVLDQPDRALDLLEEAFTRRDNELNWIEVDFEFKSIRRHPRFRALVQKLDVYGVEM